MAYSVATSSKTSVEPSGSLKEPSTTTRIFENVGRHGPSTASLQRARNPATGFRGGSLSPGTAGSAPPVGGIVGLSCCTAALACLCRALLAASASAFARWISLRARCFSFTTAARWAAATCLKVCTSTARPRGATRMPTSRRSCTPSCCTKYVENSRAMAALASRLLPCAVGWPLGGPLCRLFDCSSPYPPAEASPALCHTPVLPPCCHSSSPRR
mmetsp:Transcript_19791/g.54993  ORF Transcript_19791/g.54993 Transcript_19791/m.54993 type:complete len:215 (+) Transcript_19791:1100-1744(+)